MVIIIMMANAFTIAVILLTLSVYWSQCDLVGKMVVWERNDPRIRYTNEYFTLEDASLLQIGGEQCQNGGLYHQNHGCMCLSGFNGEKCNLEPEHGCSSNPCKRGSCQGSPGGYKCICDENYMGKHCDIKRRDRRDTAYKNELQLACHRSLDASELGMCNCEYSEHSSEVMYCNVDEGQTCIIPQEHPAISGNDTVDVYQIDVYGTVIVPPPSVVCHPHLDYTDEPHPRPVIINMDRSVEGVFSTAAEIFSSSKLPSEMEIIIMLEPAVRTLASINVSMGSDVLLPCSYDGEFYIVYWNRGDDPLSPTTLVSLDLYRSPGKRNGGQYNTGHYNITDDFSLLIKNVTIEDAGRYYCEVVPIATGVLTRSKTDVLVSKGLPSTLPFPECYMTPSNTNLKEGDAVTLTCLSFGGQPYPQLDWTSPLNNNSYPGRHVLRNVTTIQILSLSLTAKLHGAVFVCRSSHPAYMEPKECALPPLAFEAESQSSSALTTDAKILLSINVVLLIIMLVGFIVLVRTIKTLQRRIREVSQLNCEITKRRSCSGEVMPMIRENGMHGDGPV